MTGSPSASSSNSVSPQRSSTSTGSRRPARSRRDGTRRERRRPAAHPPRGGRPGRTGRARRTRGELTVTVDGNPSLPLLRYRTGDTGVLGWDGGRRTITDLEGRASVVFRSGTVERYRPSTSPSSCSTTAPSRGHSISRRMGGSRPGRSVATRPAWKPACPPRSVTSSQSRRSPRRASWGPASPGSSASDLPDSWRLAGRSR